LPHRSTAPRRGCDHPNGADGDLDFSYRLYDRKSGTVVADLQREPRYVDHPLFSPDGSFVLLGGHVLRSADGSVVSGVNPAHAGTTIVLYAFGLGLTNVKVPTGSASPAGAKIAPEIVNISYDPDIEAPPRIGPALPDHPVYVGLVAGYAGLYQINVRLPDRFPFALQDCGGTQGGINLTVSIAALQPPEAARICVAP